MADDDNNYFRPLLDELSDPDIDPAYLDYLRLWLLPAEAQCTTVTHHQSS